jgi:hypothetical protein
MGRSHLSERQDPELADLVRGPFVGRRKRAHSFQQVFGRNCRLGRLLCCSSIPSERREDAVNRLVKSRGRHLIAGWLVDNDLTDRGRRRQGWAGAMSCLRELFEQVTPCVLGTLSSPLNDIPPFTTTVYPGAEGITVRTLGIRPIHKPRHLSHGNLTDQCSSTLRSSFVAELSASVKCANHVGMRLNFEKGKT